MAKGGKGRKGGGGGGKTRKYSRDNNGRFASTGTGATARGGRLLTAKGNKRTARALAGKTKTIEAAGQKGVLVKPKGLKPGSVKAAGNPTKAAKLNTGPAKPKNLQSKDAQSDRLDVAGRKKKAKALLEMSKPARKAVRVSLLAQRAGFGGAGVSTDGRKKGSSSSAIANIDSGRMRLISDSGKRKGKLTAGQRQANERTMITSGKSLQARLRTKQIGAKVKGMGGGRKTMAAAAKPKSVITKAKPKAVSAAKPAAKPAAPKAAKAPKGGMRATKRNPLPPDSTIAKRLAMFKSDKQLTDQRTKSLRAGLKKETDPVQKIKTSSNISESQLKSKSYGDDITRMQARPIMGKRTGIGRGDKPVLGPAAKRPNTIKGKPKRDAGVAAKVKPGINLNAKKYPAIYRDRANTKGKAAAKAAKRPMR